MKSIVYLIAGTYRAAGMERVLAYKANNLSQSGYRVHIVTTDQKGRQSAYPIAGGILQTDLDIGYEDNNGKSIVNKAIHHPLRIIRHWIRLSRLLQQIRPDITVSMFCNDVSFLPLIHDGSRKMLEAHFSRYKRIQYGRRGLWSLSDRIRCRLDRFWANRFDEFIVLTHQDAELWGPMPNIRIIPNFNTMVFSQPSDVSGRQVLAVGRYDYQKGFDMLVKAWKMIDTDGWTLRIAGQGDAIPETSDNIISGFSENTFEEYRKSSIFALSSRYEGLPMVLLEAQAAGLPSVCFDCKCGPRDIVTDGIDGFLIEEGNVVQFACRLRQLMDNCDLRKEMGLHAFENSSRFTEQAVMEQWKILFEKQS